MPSHRKECLDLGVERSVRVNLEREGGVLIWSKMGNNIKKGNCKRYAHSRYAPGFFSKLTNKYMNTKNSPSVIKIMTATGRRFGGSRALKFSFFLVCADEFNCGYLSKLMGSTGILNTQKQCYLCFYLRPIFSLSFSFSFSFSITTSSTSGG